MTLLLPAPPKLLALPAKASSITRVFSFGGGTQSMAVMVLQAQRKIIPYDAFIFSNVGDDSENPDTLEYLERHAKPFGLAHGLKFIEVQKVRRGGQKDTLVSLIERTERSIPIPARMSNGAPGNRTCTDDFKIKIVDKWIKQHGYSHAVIGLGISIDEFSRMRDSHWHDKYGKRKFGFQKRRDYPLIDLRLSRHDCVALLVHAGLPIPPKSSCFFCPFTRRAEWIEMKREKPALFEKAIQIEATINAKRGLLEKDRVYLHADVVPLAQAVGDQQRLFSGELMDACESGYCLT